MYNNYVVIRVSRETREKLKDLGKKGETYEDIVRRLMEEEKNGKV